jgi:hypothetical protein
MESETPHLPWQVEAVRDQLANCGPLTASLLAKRVGSHAVYATQSYVMELWFPLRPPETDIPSDQIVKIKVPPHNVVYFLWSQRYDVKERFGVNPERTDMETLNVNS